jgi:sulfopyruvate decarboxylase TPP-binding subunit
LEWPEKVVSILKANDICSISFVPDAVIGRILKIAEKDPYFHFTTLAREEEGIGIITGEYFGGFRRSLWCAYDAERRNG